MNYAFFGWVQIEGGYAPLFDTFLFVPWTNHIQQVPEISEPISITIFFKKN